MATFAGLALGLVGGAANASPTFQCNQSGRAICIATEDRDDVSHSTDAIKRYTRYSVTVSNFGGSTLTNGSVTISLKDVQRTIVVDETTQEETTHEDEVTPTAEFIGAPAGCTPTGASTSFTCPLPNLAGGTGADPTEADALIFFARTATDATAEAMRLIVTATFKERGRDSEGPASQTDTFTSEATTELEPEPDFSQSVYFLGGSTVLSTSAGVGGQSTVFRIPVPDGFSGFELGTLKEVSFGAPGYFCPPAFSCFGQSVSTSAPSVFTGANPANLLSTVGLSLLPPGVTERSLRVHHDNASFTRQCPGSVGTRPSTGELPCRRVVIDRRAGTVTIDAWDFNQGDWGFS